MKRVREITAAEENYRIQRLSPHLPGTMTTSRKDPVQPVPVGSYVALVFRVVGYRPDCDGTLMAMLDEVDETGEATGWEENAVGVEGAIVLDDPGELHRLAAGFAPRGERTASPREVIEERLQR